MRIATLFPRGHKRYEASPVAADLEAFASWLWAAGYSREKTRDHVCRLQQALTRVRPQSPHATFTEAQLQAAFRSKSCRPHYRATQRAFARCLRQVGRLTSTSPRPWPICVGIRR